MASPTKPEVKTKKKGDGPPRYTRTAAAAVAHIEYVLGYFTPKDADRIIAFVSAGPRTPAPTPPAEVQP